MMSHDILSQAEWLKYKRHLQLPGFDEKAQVASGIFWNIIRFYFI